MVSTLKNVGLPATPAGTFIEDGDTVRIEGTAVTDEVHVAAGLTEHVITVNGESRTYSAATYNKIDIQTLEGVEVVTIVGTSLVDQADLLATRGKFVSSDYHITFNGAETISVYGGDGGLDKAILADSVGNDVFLGSASFAMMRDIENAYRNEAPVSPSMTCASSCQSTPLFLVRRRFPSPTLPTTEKLRLSRVRVG